MMSFSKYKGVTLFEVILVLVISSLFIAFSVQTYHQMLAEQQMSQVMSEVNALFSGARAYYQSNCIGNRSYLTGDVYSGGALDPSVTTSLPTGSPGNPGISPITTAALVTGGYLPTNWLIYTPTFTTGTYIVQYNIYNSTYFNNFCTTSPCTTTNNNYLITIQVAVQLSATAATNSQYYQQRLNADCVSKLSGTSVAPCSTTPTASGYLVFERQPSMAVANSHAKADASGYWPSMPGLAVFKRQYTNDDNYAATSDDTTYNTNTGYENYLCGG